MPIGRALASPHRGTGSPTCARSGRYGTPGAAPGRPAGGHLATIADGLTRARWRVPTMRASGRHGDPERANVAGRAARPDRSLAADGSARIPLQIPLDGGGGGSTTLRETPRAARRLVDPRAPVRDPVAAGGMDAPLARGSRARGGRGGLRRRRIGRRRGISSRLHATGGDQRRPACRQLGPVRFRLRSRDPRRRRQGDHDQGRLADRGGRPRARSPAAVRGDGPGGRRRQRQGAPSR